MEKSLIFYRNLNILPAPDPPKGSGTSISLTNVAMKQASPTLNPPPPDATSATDSTESRQDLSTLGAGFLNWFAHFTLYLGAVAVILAIGLYFLWQIPVPEDLTQMFKSAGHTVPARSLASAASSSSTSVNAPTSPLQPLANPATNTPEIAVATPPPVTPGTDTDPNAPPQVVESLPAAPPPTDEDQPETLAEETAPIEEPLPPTPQAEIAQLLTEAQQQIDSRRLTAPANSNALRSYQRVLELDPGNAAAQAGIEQIAAYYRKVAEQSLQQGRPDESLAYIGRGLRAAPQHRELMNLRQQARLIEQQRELAQQEALRRQQAEEELAERQYQERLGQQRAQEPQIWWQQPPTYNDSPGFNQR